MYRTLSQTGSGEPSPVTVHLCCQSQPTPVHPQNRSLVLPPNGQPVFVKRASRNGSKLVASPYNAYFDCQVMSRNHAELSCIKNGPVMIKDTSRHGTFINNKKIGPNEQMELKSGDVVRFGDSVTKTSAAPDGKVEGIVSTLTFDRKQLQSQPPLLPPRRGWNVSMPWSDDEVTPDDDEDDDASDKLRNSGLSSLDPIDLDDEDTQSDNEIAHDGPTTADTDSKAKEHTAVLSFDQDSEDEAGISSDFSDDPISENEDNHELDSNFEVDGEGDDDDLNDFFPDLDQEDVDDDKAPIEPNSPSPVAKESSFSGRNEASPELGDPPFSQSHMPLTGLTQKDNTAVTSKDTFKYRLPQSSKQAQTQTLADQTGNLATVCPVSILPPIRATGSSSAPLSDILAPMPEPRSVPKTGNSVKPLEDLLNPEPQKSTPVWYKPMHEQAALENQSRSANDRFLWGQHAKVLESDLSFTLFKEYSRNMSADSHNPQAPVQARDGAGAQTWIETWAGAAVAPVIEVAKETLAREEQTSAEISNLEAEKTDGEHDTVEPELEPQQMASQDVNADDSVSTPTTKDQANSLKRKHADTDLEGLESEELAIPNAPKPPRRHGVQAQDHRRVIQNLCAPRSVPRPSKRARTSSTSLALTAVAGAVGGAVATLGFLLSPLAERLLESAA